VPSRCKESNRLFAVYRDSCAHLALSATHLSDVAASGSLTALRQALGSHKKVNAKAEDARLALDAHRKEHGC